MSASSKEIPTFIGDRSHTKSITIWVSEDMKEVYARLRQAHNVRVAECLRRVIKKELDRLSAMMEKTG